MTSIQPVTGLRQLWAFINLPWQLYRDDPAWRPPLRLERLLHLSRQNPYFRHAEACYWLAWHDGCPVGRISAQIDRLEQHHGGAGTGHFGFLEAIDDRHVFAALLGAAEDWLYSRDVRHVTGPFNLSINHESGLLVEGFTSPPVIMMPHNPPCYSAHLEAAGYAKAKDLLAYWIHPNFQHPRAMRALLRRFQNTIQLRMLERTAFKRDIGLLREIFNEAWSRNWGFVPFTEREFDELGMMLRYFVDPEWVWIAEVNGKAAAFIIEIPNLNEAARGLNGRLLPLRWLRLIRRLRRHQFATARVPLMGVRRQYQNTPLGAALAYRLIAALQPPSLEKGISGVELSWILEDNKGMDTILKNIGSYVYKRYRVYQKMLA